MRIEFRIVEKRGGGVVWASFWGEVFGTTCPSKYLLDVGFSREHALGLVEWLKTWQGPGVEYRLTRRGETEVE